MRIVLTDVSEAGGLIDAKGDRFSFGDYDDDGDPDLLINGNALYRNDSSKDGIRFTNVSKASGIGQGPGGGACFVDLDLDGDLDVVTTNGGLKIQDEEGRFDHRAKAWGLVLESAWRASASATSTATGIPTSSSGAARTGTTATRSTSRDASSGTSRVCGARTCPPSTHCPVDATGDPSGSPTTTATATSTPTWATTASWRTSSCATTPGASSTWRRRPVSRGKTSSDRGEAGGQ